MGSSRETFTGKRLEPTRALILDDGGELLRGTAGQEKAPVIEIPFGGKAWHTQTPPQGRLHPPGPSPRVSALLLLPPPGPALGLLSPGERGALCLGGLLGAVVCAEADTSSCWIPSSSGSCL